MNQTIKMVFLMGNFFKTGDFKAALRVAKVCTRYVNKLILSISRSMISMIAY